MGTVLFRYEVYGAIIAKANFAELSLLIESSKSNTSNRSTKKEAWRVMVKCRNWQSRSIVDNFEQSKLFDQPVHE